MCNDIETVEVIHNEKLDKHLRLIFKTVPPWRTRISREVDEYAKVFLESYLSTLLPVYISCIQMTFLHSIPRRMATWWTWTMSFAVTFIRCRLKIRSTFLVKFPQRCGMQIPLNSHEHGETLKAFYGMPSLRLNSWSESRSATIFFSMGRYYETTFRAGYTYTMQLRIFNPFLRG